MTEWIDASQTMPEHGKKVLATYENRLGNRRIIVGHYVGQFEETTGCDDDWFESKPEDHPEPDDEIYLPAGWYEQQDNWDEYGFIFVNEGEITHWMPLPAAPK